MAGWLADCECNILGRDQRGKLTITDFKKTHAKCHSRERES